MDVANKFSNCFVRFIYFNMCVQKNKKPYKFVYYSCDRNRVKNDLFLKIVLTSA